VIQIDRVNTNVDLSRAPAPEGPAHPAAPTPTFAGFDRASREQFRDLVLDVLRDHLRDLERRGMR
jgi:hypothetical protein